MKAYLFGLVFITSISAAMASESIHRALDREESQGKNLLGGYQINLGSFENLDEMIWFAKAFQKYGQQQNKSKGQEAKKDNSSNNSNNFTSPFNLTSLSDGFGDDLLALAKLFLPPEFKVGNIYQAENRQNIYLQYAEGIDMTNVLKFPCIDCGFKIFRTHTREEIGYIAPNYLPHDQKICIAALWIKPECRKKGFATNALSVLIELFNEKQESFSYANRYTLSIERSNNAMLKVAQKTGFRVDTSLAGLQRIHNWFGGIEFIKLIKK